MGPLIRINDADMGHAVSLEPWKDYHGPNSAKSFMLPGTTGFQGLCQFSEIFPPKVTGYTQCRHQ